MEIRKARLLTNRPLSTGTLFDSSNLRKRSSNVAR